MLCINKRLYWGGGSHRSYGTRYNWSDRGCWPKGGNRACRRGRPARCCRSYRSHRSNRACRRNRPARCYRSYRPDWGYWSHRSNGADRCSGGGSR